MGQVITVAQQKGGSGKTTLSVNLAVELVRRGVSVALLDTDPQGSLGRWFMARRERLGDPGMDLSTASAWGVGYECEKLRKTHDIVIIDTPPKIDADLRPSLREATLVLIPVSASHVDLWATDGVLDLAARENRTTLIVLNRCKAGTRLGEEVANAAGDLAEVATARLGQRVAYAETMGNGLAVSEVGKSPAATEIAALADEILAQLQS
ncbi:ParA family partition ATPase [Pseudotabrizicola sp. 4114]|uniref:ParA family partition ATPase n=1 Tax=Pseudotabrizicola sp. 4114 TaxID=2817731 RepID=UPI00285BA852|nr:chromosome partitioning protein [Pseudorhodobacter sp. 4114]